MVTLSFDYKRRADFFKKELEEFLVILYKNDLKPFDVQGSYAGAVGLPQFMPSSIKRFGVDFDGEEKSTSIIPPLTRSLYCQLSEQTRMVEGLPMLIEADISPAQAAKFGGGTNPRFTWNQLISNGVKPLDNDEHFAGNMPVFIVDYPFIFRDPWTLKNL